MSIFGQKSIKATDFSGAITEYILSGNRLEMIKDPLGRVVKYDYDNNGQIQKVNVKGRYDLSFKKEFSYDRKSEWAERLIIRTEPDTASSSPIIAKRAESAKNLDITIPRILEEEIKDIIAASRKLPNGFIMLLFEEGKMVYVYIAANGELEKIDSNNAEEISKVIKLTSNLAGPSGNLPERWKEIYNKHLAKYAKKLRRERKSHSGKVLQLKPQFVLKSNMVNYKYAQLERMHVLVDNLQVYIASKPETTAQELAKKINNIPALNLNNMVFIFRLPKGNMDKDMIRKWEDTINELKEVVGKENVLYDPERKEEINRMMANHNKEVVVFEFTHSDEGIVLKNNEKYQSEDIMKGNSLSHIKYLIGLSCCNLPRLEDGRFVESLQKKGVGIINGPYREVGSDIGLKRLKQLIDILKDIEHYKGLSADYIQDVIDQLQNISGNETIQIGKLVSLKKQYLG